MGDRGVAITLSSISRESRKPESELWAEFKQARPLILGALLDAVSCALGDIGSVKIEGYERMADFALWVTAAEKALGWDQ
ncbi:MAG: hypothetical protein IH898_04085 [Planctomycetes bacterium]|nr:hypothetical protein [Planctomycetota bacterium]